MGMENLSPISVNGIACANNLDQMGRGGPTSMLRGMQLINGNNTAFQYDTTWTHCLDMPCTVCMDEQIGNSRQGEEENE
jgi:hypothetical protein